MPRQTRTEYPREFPWDGPIAEALRSAILERIGRGWSLNELAREAGVPQSILQRWMTGTRKDLRLTTADRLAEFLGLRVR